MLSNPRHERFAAFLAEGQSASDAYVAAGYKATTSARFGAHSLLQRHPEIKERATQILTETAERAAKTTLITKEKLIDMALKLHERAFETGQLAAGGTALRELGVLTGHRIERSEIGGPGEFEAMNDAELDRFISDEFKALFAGDATQH